ncbi:MAG: malic enzyme-like NAD(P)-binding protein [Pseudomonadota bacterium]
MNKDQKLAALELHKNGKLSIELSKPINNYNDLALAYSPGVAEPCKLIAQNSNEIWNYSNKSNTVLVVSNGSAVLGLGNIGATASIPVLEGKAALFKRFANINAIPIAITEKDPDKLIDIISKIAINYGGINLEDIKAPECFYIEEQLSQKLPIPVFHDDQHGTAIVIIAGLINACKLYNKNLQHIKVIINGAGAAGIATAKLLKHIGIKNIILCDSRGPIYKNRGFSNIYKDEFACEKPMSLEDAIRDQDVFIGLSMGNILTKEMILNMKKNAIIFALANPDPEIVPNIAKSYRDDVIIATGRSDFNNQINNILCFPYLFAGLLKYKIPKIDNTLKILLSNSIAEFAQKSPDFGTEKIIPSVFDKKLYDHILNTIRQLES